MNESEIEKSPESEEYDEVMSEMREFVDDPIYYDFDPNDRPKCYDQEDE